MGERYYITGVQLGMLQNSLLGLKTLTKLADDIVNKQFIGNYQTDEDKERFEEQIKRIREDEAMP